MNTEHQLDNLRNLAEKKEKEWREICELRMTSLEAKVKERDEQLDEEKIRFKKIKNDFEYNLKLLEERDKELETYDNIFEGMKGLKNEKNAEISELKIRLVEAKEKQKHLQKEKEELQKYYQQRLNDWQSEVGRFYTDKEADNTKQTQEYEKFKRNLERQLKETEEEMECQKRQLLFGIDEQLKKREHEYRVKVDELANSLHTKDLQVKMLNKEIELLRAAEGKNKLDIQSSDDQIQNLERQLKQKDWELRDLENTNNMKILELEGEMERMRKQEDRNLTDFQRNSSNVCDQESLQGESICLRLQRRRHAEIWYAEMDKLMKEKDQRLVSLKEAVTERENELLKSISDLKDELVKQEMETKRIIWEYNDRVQEKDTQIERGRQDLAEWQQKYEKLQSDNSRDIVARDLELETFRDSENKHRDKISKFKDEIERYKRDLNLSLEREKILEQAKAQLELDWRRRYEEAERIEHEKYENLIENLSRGKNEALALASEKERELSQRDELIDVLKRDRESMLSTLKQHGIQMTNLSQDISKSPDSQEVRNLQDQNQKLREVIRQMRQDMEVLSAQLAESRPSSALLGSDNKHQTLAPSTKTDYVNDLEKEIQQLKLKNRELSQKLEDIVSHKKPPFPKKGQISFEDEMVRNHVKELNDTIGVLRNEKLELNATIKSQEATVIHLKGLLAKGEEQLRQRQARIDQLCHELSSFDKRNLQEVSSLQKKIDDLELLLAQARREADEYYKSGVERNIEATLLGNKLSDLKLDMATGRQSEGHTSTFSRNVGHGSRISSSGIEGPEKLHIRHNPNYTRLQTKLRSAVKQITRLAQEREQLIQIGNKLRAELASYQGRKEKSSLEGKTSKASTQSETSLKRLREKYDNKLEDLENLQYMLTARKLQDQPPEPMNRADVKVTMLSTSDSSPEESFNNGFVKPSGLGRVSPDNRTEPRQAELHKEFNVTESDISEPDTRPLVRQQAGFTSSSEHSSIQAVWKLLEDTGNSALLTPKDAGNEEELFDYQGIVQTLPEKDTSSSPEHSKKTDSGSFAVSGHRVGLSEKKNAERPRMSKKAAGKGSMATRKKIIRNYNMKDDRKALL